MRANWEQVLALIAQQSDASNLIDLFELLLTPEERSAIAGRLKVFQLLLAGELSQRQIASQYHVSIATITRCSNYLKHMPIEQKDKIGVLITELKA